MTKTEFEKTYSKGQMRIIQDLMQKKGIKEYSELGCSWNDLRNFRAKRIAVFEKLIEMEDKVKEEVTYNTGGAIRARYEGRDAETGERINIGDLIQYIDGIGWVRADNC